MKVLIDAGPTRESLDPVRFITNHSTGKMGYALAAAAVRAGHSVTLVSGPVTLPEPEGLAEFVPVVTASQMAEAMKTQPEPMYFSADGVHPNANGAAYIGEKYAEYITPLLKSL